MAIYKLTKTAQSNSIHHFNIISDICLNTHNCASCLCEEHQMTICDPCAKLFDSILIINCKYFIIDTHNANIEDEELLKLAEEYNYFIEKKNVKL